MNNWIIYVDGLRSAVIRSRKISTAEKRAKVMYPKGYIFIQYDGCYQC